MVITEFPHEIIALNQYRNSQHLFNCNEGIFFVQPIKIQFTKVYFCRTNQHVTYKGIFFVQPIRIQLTKVNKLNNEVLSDLVG